MEPRTQANFVSQKYWAKARVALGIPRLRLHDLRVMFARETHARGADLKAVQGLLGHSTPTLTMHYIPPTSRRCGMRCGDGVAPPTGPPRGGDFGRPGRRGHALLRK